MYENKIDKYIIEYNEFNDLYTLMCGKVPRFCFKMNQKRDGNFDIFMSKNYNDTFNNCSLYILNHDSDGWYNSRIINKTVDHISIHYDYKGDNNNRLINLSHDPKSRDKIELMFGTPLFQHRVLYKIVRRFRGQLEAITIAQNFTENYRVKKSKRFIRDELDLILDSTHQKYKKHRS